MEEGIGIDGDKFRFQRLREKGEERTMQFELMASMMCTEQILNMLK